MAIEKVEVGQILQTVDGDSVVLVPSEEYEGSSIKKYTAGILNQRAPLVIGQIYNSALITEVQAVIGNVSIPDMIEAISRGLELRQINTVAGEASLEYLQSLIK
jgi:hypothetical protein